MKILLLSPLPPFRGGIAQFGSRLLHSMKKLNSDTEGINFSKLYPPVLFPGKTQLEQGSTAPDGILHGYNPLAWPKAAARIKEMQPDWIITQWWHPFFAPCFNFTIPANFRTAAVCHNLLPHESFPFAKALARSFLSRQNVLAVHTAQAAEEAKRFSGRTVKLFHPVYDQYNLTGLARNEARRKLGLNENQTALLFFGLVREYKGLDLLIEACSSLPEEYRIIAAGENYTSRNYASPRLLWENRFIPDSQVGTWFNASDIVVLPYRSATQSGIAKIALSFRKPLVVTPVGGLPDSVEQGLTGWVSKDTSSKSLAEAILQCKNLIDKPETARAIAAKAASLSWGKYAEKLLEALE
ncbi:hypothetical protein CSA37_03710 [Candidatus Fermentibacteria bacterium]|nr:MAG: hypothetical protein CSA37_03710 [Candidatus Fermentibacteria bacterium]